MATRRTLYRQQILPEAASPQAPLSRSEARFRLHGVGGSHGAGYKRNHLPPLEVPLGEMSTREAPREFGEGDRPSQEAACLRGAEPRHLQAREPGNHLSPTQRRADVEYADVEYVRRLGVSECRAGGVIGQPRSSQRYAGSKAIRNRRLVERDGRALSQENIRYGYRRVWTFLRPRGWPVDVKQVHRLWWQKGLNVPDKQRKRRRLLLGESENG